MLRLLLFLQQPVLVNAIVIVELHCYVSVAFNDSPFIVTIYSKPVFKKKKNLVHQLSTSAEFRFSVAFLAGLDRFRPSIENLLILLNFLF